MTNMPHVIETALLLLVAFLIGCVIGYVLRCHIFANDTQESDAQKQEKPAKPSAKSAPGVKSSSSKDGRPDTLDAPRGGRKDDLKQIKGIGPGIEKTLNELGIFHFDQIATWNRKASDWIDDYLSFKGRIDREKWVSQAKKLTADN